MFAFVFAFHICVEGQACGYSKLIFYSADRSGKPVENTEIKFFDGEGGHLKINGGATRAYWDKLRNAVVVVHGLCGEHPKVNLTISAEDYKPVEHQVSLYFGSQSFIVRFEKNASKTSTVIEQLSNLRVYVSDIKGSAITNSKIILTDISEKRFEAATDKYGIYDFEVPIGQYKIEVIGSNGFASARFDNLQLRTGQPYIKTVLQVDTKCDCLVTEIICKPKEWNEKDFSCELVTKNTGKQN